MIIIFRNATVCIFLAAGAVTSLAQSPVFVSAEPLPTVVINGDEVQIHSQGLFVTEQDYFVTGRVDTPPRRPVMVRFPRDNPHNYEVLDLTAKAGLNHPGGFDRDRNGVFWIPVSTSHPRGPTTVFAVSLDDGRLPSSVSEITKSFEVPDHLGAICCLDGGRLLAANWDTQTVYVIDSDSGEIPDKFKQEAFFRSFEPILLAVQDWKFDRESKLVIAGGIDKSPNRKSDQSSAIVARIDPAKRSVVSTIRLESRDDVTRPLTNEGLALFGRELFLLPEDLGRGAKVLRFSIRFGESDK